jgi:CRP-like cAMP-binding protein
MNLCSDHFIKRVQRSFISKSDFYCDFQYISYPKQALIFEEGFSLKGVYLILSGVCKISKMSSNGKYQIIQFLKEKTFLGIRSTLNNEPTNLKAETLTQMKVCFVPKEYLFDQLNSDIEFSKSLMKILAQYIKEADNKIVSLGNKKLEERLATFLLYLHTEFYNTSQDGYPFYLKREEIANYIGVATESMIRMLKNFEQKNLIGLEGRKIILKDRIELERIAKGLT